jgi:putative protease
MKNGHKLELLAPAGNLEKMETALRFGADAVYFGLPDFSLRARSNQFSKKDILEAGKICRDNNKEFYITMNIYAHNIHLGKVKEQLQWLSDKNVKPSGIIVADPGIIKLIKEYLPEVDIHLSTQANATNIEAVKFWRDLGIKRVVLAREVTVDEIKEIHEAVPGVELEVFIHGAMCMSYSGRCILSKWMTDRSANLGDCAQPCRWKWSEKSTEENDVSGGGCGSCEDGGQVDLSAENSQVELIDDKDRFGMRVEEDQHETYMFNSYDISLVEYMDKLINAGVVSFKIEGRAKSVYYVAVITRAYRKIIMAIQSDVEELELNKIIKEQVEELKKMSNRGYWTGFVLGDEPPHLFDKAYQSVDWEFAGIANNYNLDSDKGNKTQQVFVHNKLTVNDEVEVITVTENKTSQVISIKNEDGEPVEAAHGGLGKTFEIKFSTKIPSYFLIRKKQSSL